MERISTPTRAIDLHGAGKDGFKDGDLANSILPTDLNALWFNQVQEELARIVEESGQVLDAGELNQVLKGLKRLFGGAVAPVAAGVTALTADHAGLLLVDASAGNITINLPLAALVSGVGLEYTFYRTDSSLNTVTVNRAGADTIDGATSFNLVGQYASRTIKGDAGAAWTTTANTATAGAALDGGRNVAVAPYNPDQGSWLNVGATETPVASGFFNLYSTTNNDGHIIGDTSKFGAVSYNVSQVQAGSPVYVYEYWNGAWVALPTLATPTWTALGMTQLRFTPPVDWVVGGSGVNVPAGNFNIRLRATTAPSQAVQGRGMLVNKVSVTADEMVLSNAAGTKQRHAAISAAPDILLAGSVANGRDQAGAFGTTSWVHLWAQSNGDGVVGLWSASPSAPTISAGYTGQIYLGAARIDGNGLLVPYLQRGNEVALLIPFSDLALGTATTPTAITLTVPPNATRARGRFQFNYSANNGAFLHDRPFAVAGTSGATTEAQRYELNWTASPHNGRSLWLSLSQPQTAYYALLSAVGTDYLTQGWSTPGNLS